MTDVGLCRMQRAKHLYKCLTQSITSKVRDNLDPYIKAIRQDGPLFFKYLMLEVASNPSSEAEARDICQMLSQVNLIKQMKSERNNVKSFNLYIHSQLTKLASYTIVQKEDLDADLMATYHSIPCTSFRAEMRLLDRERRVHAWNPKKILSDALLKYNDVRTNEEWQMDIKDADPPINPLALPAMRADPHAKSGKDRPKGKDGSTPNRDNNWKYLAPKTGESETKTHTKPDGIKEKRMWCAHKRCKHWTLSHTTSGHGMREGEGEGQKAPKAEDLKLQNVTIYQYTVHGVN